MTTATASIADRLGSTIFIAALAHGLVILGVTFSSAPFKAPTKTPALNVTLLVDTADSDAAPEHTEYLANRNELGGAALGASHRPATTAPDPIPSHDGDPAGIDPIDGTPAETTAATDELRTRGPSDRRVDAAPDTSDAQTDRRMRAASTVQREAPQTLALEIDDQAAADGADREGPASPSATESAVAAYLVGWRERVERVGTANFPTRFLGAGKEHGSPTLEVAIGPQGRLEEIVVRKSSGDERLDQAALKILRLAAPFEPLPPSIRRDHDTLRFAYEWDFSTGDGTLSASAD
jgi:protein TonB